MNSINKVFLTLFMLFAFSATLLAQDGRKISVSGFSGVSLGGSGKVYVSQGSGYSVEFFGSDEIFEEMKFDVRGNTLHIGRKSKSSWWSWGGSKGSYEVRITMPEIEYLSVSGSGLLEVAKKFRTRELELSISGSGELNANTDASEVEISVSGSGRVNLEGSARELQARISGSGKVDGKDFSVDEVEARISGSGSVYVHANESIESRISGSGSVYYSGNPGNINNNSSGSGKIRKMN